MLLSSFTVHAKLRTTLIGAYPKPGYVTLPNWFNQNLSNPYPSSAFDSYIQKHLEQQPVLDKATHEVVQEQNELGIDILTDGELRRENYIYYHCRHLHGIDFNTLTLKTMREGAWVAHVPTITEQIHAAEPFLSNDYRIAQEATTAPIKMTLPGPITIMDSIADKYYFDEKKLGTDLAHALNKEILELVKAGCEWIQIDEPLFARYPKKALEFGITLLNKCMQGVPDHVTTVVHICCGYPEHLDQKDYLKADSLAYFKLAPALDKSDIDVVSLEDTHQTNLPELFALFKNKTIMLGVIDISNSRIESADEIKQHIQNVLIHIPEERLIIAPDCGLGMLPKNILLQKIKNMVTAVSMIA